MYVCILFHLFFLFRAFSFSAINSFCWFKWALAHTHLLHFILHSILPLFLFHFIHSNAKGEENKEKLYVQIYGSYTFNSFYGIAKQNILYSILAGEVHLSNANWHAITNQNQWRKKVLMRTMMWSVCTFRFYLISIFIASKSQWEQLRTTETKIENE